MRHETRHRIAQQRDKGISPRGTVVQVRIILHMARDHPHPAPDLGVQLIPPAGVVVQYAHLAPQCLIALTQRNRCL